jgi:hypothetical protein
MHLPPLLARMLPAQLLAAFFKALGNAEVDLWRRTLRFSSFRENALPLMQLPSYDEIVAAVGPPHTKKEIDGLHYLAIYDFACKIGPSQLEFKFAGVFRNHLLSMQKSRIVFGNYVLDISEDSLQISTLESRKQSRLK